MKKDYEFIGKSVFFPKKGILAIGDLHLGYDYMIQQSGVLIPERQAEEVISDLKFIFREAEKRKLKIKKLIFIGDIKHSFAYEWTEKNYFREVLNFLKTKFDEKDIIFIRGNHDTIDYSFGKMKDFYIEKDIAFIHGDKTFLQIFDRKIKTIVLGHIHPSIMLSEKKGVKKEKYKCFLAGKFKNKEVIILPNFLSTVEGAIVNNIGEEYEDYFSIIPKKALINFSVYVIGEDKVYEFGKVKEF